MTAIALARNLAEQARVVLVELCVAAPNLSVIASDPAAPGLAELVHESAGFGQIITRDRHSRAHLVLAGRTPIDGAALINSQRLAIAIEALARSYDHVILDAGMVEGVPLARLATLARSAVLVAADSESAGSTRLREDLLSAGFTDVSVLVQPLPEPDRGLAGDKAAA
jgi:Mrp family chromosome partitioning ATPase